MESAQLYLQRWLQERSTKISLGQNISLALRYLNGIPVYVANLHISTVKEVLCLMAALLNLDSQASVFVCSFNSHCLNKEMGKDMKILILKKQMNMMDLIKTNLLHNLPLPLSLIAQMQMKAGKTKYYTHPIFFVLQFLCDLVVYLCTVSIISSLSLSVVIVQMTIRHNHPCVIGDLHVTVQIMILTHSSSYLMMFSSYYGRTILKQKEALSLVMAFRH